MEANKRGYIAQAVLPIFSAPSQCGKYPVINPAQLLAQRDVLRGPNGAYSRSSFTFYLDPYDTTEYGAEEPVDDNEKKMYVDYIDVEMNATVRAASAVLAAAEKRAVDLLTDTNVITQTVAAGYAWSDPTYAQPLDDFASARYLIWSTTGIWCNAIVMSRCKFNQVVDCLQIVDRIKGNSNYKVLRGEITPEMVAAAFDVDRIIISDAVKNAAKEGQTVSVASAWPDASILVCKVATTNDLREPCIGRTFHWAEDGSQPLGLIETYRDEKVRCDIVRCRHQVQEKVMYPQAGALITGA